MIKNGVQAKTELPELVTKQDKRNIRFISNDGRYTYYQRSNGSLQFSTNYKVEEVIRLKERTQFNIIASHNLKYLILEADDSYNTYLSLKPQKKIYIIQYGTTKITKIEDGIALGLHLNDQYISYFNPAKKTLNILNHLNTSVITTIKLANTKNPYFIPQVVMPDVDTIIYTDLNKEGLPGVLIHKINSNKTTVLEKLNTANKQIELCLDEKRLYLAYYGLDPLTKGSSISYLDPSKLNIEDKVTFYQSTENDLGSIKCNLDKNQIYIIKRSLSQLSKITYDAAQINSSTKEVKVLSDINFATSLILMDGKLLLPYQNKHYVIKGINNLTKFDKLKAKNIE